MTKGTDVLGFARKVLRRPDVEQQPKTRDLVVLGSSSSEAFDYLIGRNENYYPYWASGWTARGLRNEAHQEYISKLVSEIDRSACVLLNFGAADILFSARYKATHEGYYDFATFLQEIRQGIIKTRDTLLKIGFKDVMSVFIAPIVDLPQTFWQQRGLDRQLPNQSMGRMYHDLCLMVQNDMPTFDTFEKMSRGAEGSFFLKPEYRRANADTHPDYIAMQDILWQSMTDHINGPLVRREERLLELYPHEQILIGTLLPTSTPRKNTCR